MMTRPRFAICVANDGCDELVLMKVYRVLPDARAAKHEYVRVEDESSEDFLYAARRFVTGEFPPAVTKRLLAVPG